MTLAEFEASALEETQPPEGLSSELRALWFSKKGDWHQAHDIAQEIHTPAGSWIHALLHLIEGDVGNANYWFYQANKKPVGIRNIDNLWSEIASELLKN